MSNITSVVFDQANEIKTIYNGLWQYDYGQILRIEGLDLPAAVEIHFSLQETGGEAKRRIGKTSSGVTDVVIPDFILEGDGATSDYEAYAFIYLSSEESGETTHKIKMKIKSRPVPEGSSGSDETSFGAIMDAIKTFAAGKADGLKYENSILKLMSGEAELARVTIKAGEGTGTDAREIELQKSDTAIQWRYVGDEEWTDLVLLEELKGEKGDPGEGGKTAYQYAQDGGYTGTEEKFAKKLAQENPTREEFSQLSDTVNDMKEDIENVGNPTDEQISNAVNDYLAENPVSGGMTSGIKLGLPKRYELVEGDKFELFYKGIIDAVYPEILFPMVNSISAGFPIAMYTRKFAYTPAGANYINRNGKYRIDLYDNNKNLLDSQETYLLTRPKATNPTEEKVVLYVSDSLANFGNVPDEFYQRVQKDKLTNVKFIGTQRSQDNAVPYEGYGGWTFGNYNSVSTSSAEMYITTEHNKTNDDKHGIYKDSNGTQWRLEDIGATTIKITRYSGTTELPSTGTLTWVSGGVNTSNIVYTNSKVGSSNPFCIGGKVDFGAYADSQGVEKIDYIYVLLGWNNFPSNEGATKTRVLEFCNNVWASFPSCRITLLGLQIPARDGCGLQYGAGEAGNYQKRVEYVFRINKWYEELAEIYSEYLLSFVNLSGQFDSEYNLITEEIQVNARNPLTETIQSDGLHPSTYGHYQIADVCYRDLHHKLQEETVSLTQDLTGVVSSTHSEKVINGKPLEIVLSGGNSDGTGWMVKDSDITVTMNGENQTTKNGVFLTDSVTGDIIIEATVSEFVPYETAFVELSVPATYKLTPVSWTVENPPTYAKVDNNPNYELIDNNYASRESLIAINESGITVYKPAVGEYIKEFTKFYDGAKKIYLTQGYVPHGTTTYNITVVENGGGEVEPDTPTEVTLSSISATYNGGNVLVGTSVNALTGITVTGHYSDGSTKTITDYTLSGTIAEGNNTITVSYDGKTTTFVVVGYVEESDEPVEVGTIYVEEGRYDYANAGGTIDTEVGSVSDGFTTTAIPVKVGDVIDCTFGSTYSQFDATKEVYNYVTTNNRIIEYNSDGTYSKFAYAPEYPWTSDINGYIRLAHVLSYGCSLTGITLNGAELDVVNNTTTSKPYVVEGEEEVTFPFESKEIKLSGNGVYYLTPIETTGNSGIYTYSTDGGSTFVKEITSGNVSYRKVKITISDSGINMYIPKYEETGGNNVPEQNLDIAGATQIEFRVAWSNGGPGITTFRVDTDESQWGVGMPVKS